MDERPRVKWADFGVTPYRGALALQSGLAARLRAGPGAGWVLFMEHPATITLGYSLRGDEGRSAIVAEPSALASAGVEVVEVDRGGKATYHGPGQLVCYPVLSLREVRLGVKRYVGALMDVVLESLRELGVAAELDPAYPGVWVGGAKIAAIGIRVQDRVTTHGFAINMTPDLAAYKMIVPCGIADRPVTSLAALGTAMPERAELIRVLLGQMEKKLKISAAPAAPDEIWPLADKEAC